ncbi:substrate-binding domain-containing protein [Bacteroidota bacterium]
MKFLIFLKKSILRNYNYVWQDFDEAVFDSLSEIKDKIKRYSKFHFINPDRLQHPRITLNAFNRFCNENDITGNVINSTKEINITDGDAYFILRQRDLYTILSQCKEKKYEVGKNIGILAYNDSPLYEFVSCGITVISTDFKEMGKKASQFIKGGITIKETIPTKIILRKSL